MAPTSFIVVSSPVVVIQISLHRWRTGARLHVIPQVTEIAITARLVRYLSRRRQARFRILILVLQVLAWCVSAPVVLLVGLRNRRRWKVVFASS